MPNDEVEVGVSDTRSDVAAAFEKLSSAPEAPAAPVAEATPSPTPEAQGDRQRDEKGRFASKTPADVDAPSAPPAKPAPAIESAGEPGGAVAAGGPPAPAAEPVLKAPQSWTPSEREAFSKAPPEVQRAALRREAEITKALNETAEPRKLREAVAPYEHLFRAAGLSNTQAVGNILQTYAQLTSAPQHVRTSIIAGFVKNFLGTDEAAITALAHALEGTGTAQPTQPTFDPNQIQAIIRQQLEQERREAQRSTAVTVLQQFEATAPEYLEDVRADMSDVLGSWERRNPGAPVTIDVFKQAYERACLINPEVSAILKQKEAAKVATNANASTQKAKAVSSSIKSQPGGPSAPPALGDDTRSHVAAAWEKLAAQ